MTHGLARIVSLLKTWAPGPDGAVETGRLIGQRLAPRIAPDVLVSSELDVDRGWHEDECSPTRAGPVTRTWRQDKER